MDRHSVSVNRQLPPKVDEAASVRAPTIKSSAGELSRSTDQKESCHTTSIDLLSMELMSNLEGDTTAAVQLGIVEDLGLIASALAGVVLLGYRNWASATPQQPRTLPA